ncbi:PPE domain-containing protein [Streptomyces sp. NPDC059897]|uniref:PPE domain-containing protein n=1 Tax=Streptomyces sp. NPDC059897 TaxID=3346994 RepID=UPI003664EBBC
MGDQGADYTYQAPTQCYVGDNTTDFKNLDMDTMKAMVQGAKPEDVHRAARGWKGVQDQLVAAKEAYEHAVAEVMEHWEGPSADQFQTRSKTIAKKLQDTSTYASHVSTAMTSAANVLGDIQPMVMAMQKPSGGSSVGDRLTDGGRDEEGLNRDLANKNVTAQQIADGREGDMSEGREAQMAMAVKMEELGAAYNSQAKSMGSWRKTGSGKDQTEDYPGEPGGIAPVPIPAGSASRPSGGVAGGGNLNRSTGSASSVKGVKAPTTGGISGGIGSQKPTAGSQIGSGNLSFNGGSGPGAGGIGTGAGGGTGIGGGMAGTGAGAGAGGVGGTGIGGGIGAGAGLGAGAGAAGRGGAMGRGGLGAGGVGAGGAGQGAAKGMKGDSLARTKGGAIGKSVMNPGAGQQGGSALRQKPKTATGGAGAAGRAGLAGHGAQTANGKDKKRRDSARPDYLVEDEETWASNRTVNPKVVE